MGNTTNSNLDQKRISLRLLARGWRRRCPSCGNGPMMRGYLTLRKDCPVCSDDIQYSGSITGAIILSMLLSVILLLPFAYCLPFYLDVHGWLMLAGFILAYLPLVFILVPRILGMLVALGWAKRQGR